MLRLRPTLLLDFHICELQKIFQMCADCHVSAGSGADATDRASAMSVAPMTSMSSLYSSMKHIIHDDDDEWPDVVAYQARLKELGKARTAERAAIPLRKKRKVRAARVLLVVFLTLVAWVVTAIPVFFVTTPLYAKKTSLHVNLASPHCAPLAPPAEGALNRLHVDMYELMSGSYDTSTLTHKLERYDVLRFTFAPNVTYDTPDLLLSSGLAHRSLSVGILRALSLGVLSSAMANVRVTAEDTCTRDRIWPYSIEVAANLAAATPSSSATTRVRSRAFTGPPT
jgi:hypothetical protein